MHSEHSQGISLTLSGGGVRCNFSAQARDGEAHQDYSISLALLVVGTSAVVYEMYAISMLCEMYACMLYVIYLCYMRCTCYVCSTAAKYELAPGELLFVPLWQVKGHFNFYWEVSPGCMLHCLAV